MGECVGISYLALHEGERTGYVFENGEACWAARESEPIGIELHPNENMGSLGSRAALQSLPSTHVSDVGLDGDLMLVELMAMLLLVSSSSSTSHLQPQM